MGCSKLFFIKEMDETQQLLYKFRNLTISENEKLKLKQKADHFYFNTEKEILTDNEYDILAEAITINKCWV